MGGKGSGGSRVGAGRPRKGQAEGALTGSRRTRARAKQANQTVGATNQTAVNQTAATTEAPSESAPQVQIPQPPGSLTLDELAEWNELAPRAAKQATLTDDTLWALADLCRDRVLHTQLTRDIRKMGNVVVGSNGNYAANPLLARFTTLAQRIEAKMLRFRLSPMGKEIPNEVEKPADPFAEFDGGSAKTADGETRH